jgi:hypothetical protein
MYNGTFLENLAQFSKNIKKPEERAMDREKERRQAQIFSAIPANSFSIISVSDVPDEKNLFTDDENINLSKRQRYKFKSR